MSVPRGESPDPCDGRDVDAEFSRMMADEGLVVPPGRAPLEPAAEDAVRPDRDDDLWSAASASPAEPPSEESRARARAAHPAAGRRPPELDDDDPLYGDFVPPDPDLPAPSSRMLWSWTGLVGGLVLLLVVAVSATLPMWLGALGGLVAVGGLVALLLRVPTSRDEDDGAEL